MPIVLILMSIRFQYTPLYLGLFNVYLGIGFAIGLLVVLPKMVKRMTIEKVVAITLLVACIAQIVSSLVSIEWVIWLLALPYGIAIEIAFTGMFTAFSNAADEQSQGWVMGISVAVLAIAWALAGFAAELAHTISPALLIFLGGLSLAMSTLLMGCRIKKVVQR